MSTTSQGMSQRRINVALAFVGLMFFSIGFALGINSYLLPVLRENLSLSGGMSNMILAATFVPFLLFSYPSSLLIRRIGYKYTMAVSFVLFALAFVLFIPATKTLSFGLFLLASFVSGTANCVLQNSVNPYVTILGPIESGARRMSIMGIVNKLAWPIAPLFLALVIGKSIDQTVISDLTTPFIIIIGIFALLAVISSMAPLPEIKAKGEDEEEEIGEEGVATNKTSIWQFPHLWLGALALFFYVGVETVALSSLVDYATELKLSNAASYAWISSIGMVLGYIAGVILVPKYLSQAKAMMISVSIGIAGSFLVVLLPVHLSIWALFLVAVGCSLIWPAIWPLAMMDLGRHTKTGASLLTMAIAGGAVIPPLFGWFQDIFGGMQQAYWIMPFCFLFILYYAVSGYKIRT